MKKILFVIMMLGVPFGMNAQKSDVTRETTVYSVIGKDTLKMDTYIKSGAEVPPQGRPVIMYVHGGGFTAGSRVVAAQEFYLRYMAEHGWLAIAVDYRLAGTGNKPDGKVEKITDLKDGINAVRIAAADVVDATNFVLRQREWKADPTKFCLGGGSAGAMIVLQTVYDACNDEPYTQKLPKDFAYAGVISQAGCITIRPQQQSLAWKKKPCPMMLFHGTEDFSVPLGILDTDYRYVGTLPIVRQLEAMDVPYWKWIEHGADHIIAMTTLSNYLEEQYRFLHDFVEQGIQTSVNTEVRDKVPVNMASVEAMIKYAPLYILGYGKYLDQMDWNNLPKPGSVVY